MASASNNQGLGLILASCAQEFHAVGAGPNEVRNHQVEGVFSDHFDRFAAIAT